MIRDRVYGRTWISHQGKPTEYQVEKLIKHLNVNPKLAEKSMGRAIDVVKVEGRVDGGEERSVKPPSTLRD